MLIEIPTRNPQGFDRQCKLFETDERFKCIEKDSYKGFMIAKYEDLKNDHTVVSVYFNNWNKIITV